MQAPETDESNEPFEAKSAVALQTAVDNEDVIAIRAILQNDPSLAHKELESGFTPWENTKLSSEDVIDVFLDAGVDIDWQDAQGRTLAHFCAEDGVIDTLITLLKRGADRHVCDNENLGLLDYAVRGKQVETTGHLLGQGCTWDRETLRQLQEDDTRGCRDLLLADLARIESTKAFAEIGMPPGKHSSSSAP